MKNSLVLLLLLLAGCATRPPGALLVEGDYEAPKHGLVRFHLSSEESANQAKKLMSKFCAPQGVKIEQTKADLGAITTEIDSGKEAEAKHTTYTTATMRSNVYVLFKCEGAADRVPADFRSMITPEGDAHPAEPVLPPSTAN